MLLAEHYVFVTIFSLAFALPWVDHSLFLPSQPNYGIGTLVVAAITRNVMELTHYGHKLPIDKIVSTGVITVFLNWI